MKACSLQSAAAPGLATGHSRSPGQSDQLIGADPEPAGLGNQRLHVGRCLIPAGTSSQFVQPGMLPSGKQLSGTFPATRVTWSATGLPLLA